MKTIHILWVLLLVIPPNIAVSGVITDELKGLCPNQFQRYKHVDKLSSRMQDYVMEYGCGVVSAYGEFANKKDMARIYAWEDDDQSFDIVSQTFLIAEKYNLDVFHNHLLYDVLEQFMFNTQGMEVNYLDSLIAQMPRMERQALNRNPEDMIYYMFAVEMSSSKSIPDVFRLADDLRQDYPQEKIIIAMMLNIHITLVYPDITSKKRLRMIQQVMQSYSSEFMGKVISSELAAQNLSWLLPPQPGDVDGSQGITDRDITTLKNHYNEIMNELIHSLDQKNPAAEDHFGIAVDSASVLAPYIIQALVDAPDQNHSIVSYLKDQISSPVFEAFIRESGSCNDEDFSKRVASFFMFLAPTEKHQDRKHHLARIAQWYHDDKNMKAWVINSQHDPQTFIGIMARLPYFYDRAAQKSRKYMSELLLTLPGTSDQNGAFVLALATGSQYFHWLATAPDAETTVVANEAAGDKSTAKYRYILTTGFPNQKDASVFDKFEKNGSGIPALSLLQNYTIDELSSHLFTDADKLKKLAEYMDKADNAGMVIVFFAGSITSVAALVWIGAEMAVKKTVKESFKYVMKAAVRNVSRSGRRLSGKEGWQAFKREVKEISGYAKKRGRPSQYAGTQAKMTTGLQRVEHKISLADGVLNATIRSANTTALATGIYCQKFSEGSSFAWLHRLCNPKEVHSGNGCL